MSSLNNFKNGYFKFLEVVVVINIIALALVVTIGFVSRFSGTPFSWYDEVASIGLAWLTYYGAALAAAKGAHIGCPSVVNYFPPSVRLPIALVAEVITIGFFVLLAYTGMQVLLVLEGSTMVSITSVSLQVTQSAIPVGAVLFIVAELLRLPDVIASAKGDGFIDHELEEAGVKLAKS